MSQYHIEETIDIEEFASRINVKKNTVRDWISAGYLQPGVHFAKIRSVILIPWPLVIAKLLDDSRKNNHPGNLDNSFETDSPDDSGSSSIPNDLPNRTKNPSNIPHQRRSGININY